MKPAEAGRIAVKVGNGAVAITGGFARDGAEMDALIAMLQGARRKAFGLPKPSAITMEIFESGRKSEDGTGSVILPNAVLINGHSVYTDGGVRIHEMTIKPAMELAAVTVTMPVRCLIIAAEGDL